MIRIVGLSATLPNYLDVARFLRVNFHQGLFFFDARFRPVPLGKTFIGIKARNIMGQLQDMDTVCYEKVLDNVDDGYQVCMNQTWKKCLGQKKNMWVSGFFLKKLR
jgi:activating signal cointegrator complex subunit 3